MTTCWLIDYLSPAWIDQAVTLDKKNLGGIWSADQYHSEILRPSGIVLGLFQTGDRQTGNCQPKEETDVLELSALACLWGIVDEAHITMINVDPEHQKRRLGTLLLNRLLLRARDANLARATLEVRASNQAAIHLYEKFKFECLGKRTQYYSDNEDGLIFWLRNLSTDHYLQFLEQQWRQLAQQFENQGTPVFDRS